MPGIDIFPNAGALPSADSFGPGGIVSVVGEGLRQSTGDAWQSPTVATGLSQVVTDADALTVGGVIVPQHLEVTFGMLANGSLADQCFFVANRAYQVTAIREVHSVAGNDAGAVNLQVTKDTGTNAPGAGTDLLTDNTGAGFNLKGTANTVQTGTLTGTAASLQLAAGDRLSVDFAGTLTTLAGVVVTVSLKRI